MDTADFNRGMPGTHRRNVVVRTDGITWHVGIAWTESAQPWIERLNVLGEAGELVGLLKDDVVERIHAAVLERMPELAKEKPE